MTRRLPQALAIGLGLAAFAAPACLGPTEIWVELSTDVKCADLRGTTISVGEVGAVETATPIARTVECREGGRIGSLVVVPSGSSESVTIKVVSGMVRDVDTCAAPAYGPGCIVARRALRFLPRTSLRLPIVMGAACNGIACEATETCVRGTCEEATIDPNLCRGAGCEEGALFPADAGPPAGDAGDDAGAAPTDAGVDAPSDAGPLACPSGRGPVMLPVNVGGRSFCIDSTEVLEKDYAAFRVGAALGQMPPACAFKATHQPGSTYGAAFPLAWIDWCDAWAFCRWAGKRLCTHAEWTGACTAGTSNAYPYGPTFSAAACNDTEGTVAPAKSFAGCEGGVPGLYDMSGNVDEWIDSCDADAGPRGSCVTLGGDFNDTVDGVTCTSAGISARDYISRVRGVRCCAN